MKTGVTFDCPCGATAVGLAWGWTAYRHTTPNGDRCGGPQDLFGWMLRNAELAMVGDGMRLATEAEVDTGRFCGGRNDPRGASHSEQRELS